MIKHQVSPDLRAGHRLMDIAVIPLLKRIDYDLYYIENWTLSLDLDLLTIFKGFVNKMLINFQ